MKPAAPNSPVVCRDGRGLLNDQSGSSEIAQYTIRAVPHTHGPDSRGGQTSPCVPAPAPEITDSEDQT